MENPPHKYKYLTKRFVKRTAKSSSPKLLRPDCLWLNLLLKYISWRKKNVFDILYFDVFEICLSVYFCLRISFPFCRWMWRWWGRQRWLCWWRAHTVFHSTHYEVNIWLDTVQIFIVKSFISKWFTSLFFFFIAVWTKLSFYIPVVKTIAHHLLLLAKKIINHFFTACFKCLQIV